MHVLVCLLVGCYVGRTLLDQMGDHLETVRTTNLLPAWLIPVVIHHVKAVCAADLGLRVEFLHQLERISTAYRVLLLIFRDFERRVTLSLKKCLLLLCHGGRAYQNYLLLSVVRWRHERAIFHHKRRTLVSEDRMEKDFFNRRSLVWIRFHHPIDQRGQVLGSLRGW